MNHSIGSDALLRDDLNLYQRWLDRATPPQTRCRMYIVHWVLRVSDQWHQRIAPVLSSLNKQLFRALVPPLDACAPCPTHIPNSPSFIGQGSPSTESSIGGWRVMAAVGSYAGRVRGLGSTPRWSSSWPFWRGSRCVVVFVGWGSRVHSWCR